MTHSCSSASKFNAATGATAFDQISWSAPPISKLIAAGSDGVQAIRHLGSDVEGTLQTRSRGNQRPDSLMLAKRSCGVFEARVGGSFKASKLARDLCCYLPHGADADLEFPSLSQALVLHFPAGFLARHIDPSHRQGLDPLLGSYSPSLATIMGMIERELAAPSFGHELFLDGLYRCVAPILARASELPRRPTPDRMYISPAKIRRVIDYIEANLANKITIQDLANVAGISMFHFSRVFKKAVNQTPYQYVRSRRLLRAQTLMESDRHSLAEIGLSCGFANQAHFTSAFVKETGMPPGRYRRALVLDG